MSKKQCPNHKCNEIDHSSNAKYCHRCGTRLRKYNLLKWIGGVVCAPLVAFFIFFFVEFTMQAKEQAREDGKLAALQYNECRKNIVENLQRDVDSILSLYSCANVTSNRYREDLEDELSIVQGKRKRIYETEIKEAERSKESLKNTYKKRSLTYFDESFNNTIADESFDVEEKIQKICSSEKVKSYLNNLCPRKPDSKQIAQDLVGHKLKGITGDDFFDDSWNLVIKVDDIENVDISSSSYKDVKWTFSVFMKVRERGHHLSVRADIIYELGYSKEKWNIIDVITQYVSIVKTTTYSNAISLDYSNEYYWDYMMYKDVSIASKSESRLLVGIYVWSADESKWKPRKIVLTPDKKVRICCSVRNDGRDPILIDFVERDFGTKGNGR